MAFFDLSLEDLKKFKPDIKEPEDFDLFWKKTIEASEAEKPSSIKLHPYEIDFPLIEAFDAEFPGFMGHPIKGWLLLPKNTKGPFPLMVEYIGYGGGRGLPTDWLGWVISGYAYFIMDTRGQGTTWRTGDTADKGDYHCGPELPGFMTRGIQHQDNYYYRRLICDAYRAIDAVKSLDMVDKSRIAITGGSQGGALTLSVAGLRNDIAAAMADVPFLCFFERAITLVDSHPYNEIARYLQRHRHKEKQILGVLNYFDGCHFAKRAKARALFSTALMDTICPPSTVYAAYNHYKGNKDIIVYPFNNHEGGESYQHIEKLKFLNKLFK
ncbi:MAG: acetylxylan esterase [Spirochaetales bacterium]|nr:acetylxylan esterase [Spirochaetales bacterium]